MKAKLFILLIILIPALCWNCKPKEKRAPLIPLEDFFKNPEKTAYQISPDGKYFSFLAPVNNRMNIFIQAIDEDTARQITYEADRDIAGYFWANKNRLLYQKDVGGNENFRLYGVNLDGSDLICYTDFEGVITEVIDDLPDINDEVIIQMNKRNPQVFDPYRLNIITGEMKMLAENPGNIVGWLTDHEGKLRVAMAITDGVNQTLLYRDTEKENFRPVLTTTYKDNFSPHFFTFDNKYLYASSDLGRDKQEIIIFDPATKTEIDTLYKNDEVDVTGLSYSRKRKVLTEATYFTDKRQHYFFDPETKALYERLAREIGQYEISLGASDKEENVYIVRTYSDRTRGAYYLYNKITDELQKIHDISPWLKEDSLAVMKPIQYTSRDSITIHGYLTLPVGVKAKNLPVVVNPHGGPWARDYWGFNPEVQFLANRGYAVLQMNFRGSTGYGKNFVNISYKQWGRTMQNDITDGVKWLIDQGIADKNRIAIYGGSYGGYATLAGLTLTPDLYACGIDYVGVSNLFTFMNTIPPYWEPMREMFYEMVGHPVKDSIWLAEVSPVLHADRIKVPLLIAQGANDPRVNKNESDQMVEALKKRGITVEYMVKDNEGHGFRNEENRFDFYRAMEKFLANHIGQPQK